jgi:hypothetical protein
VKIQQNNKIRLFLGASLRLQRWAGWALFAAILGAGGMALGTCESGAARGALSLLYRLLWA